MISLRPARTTISTGTHVQPMVSATQPEPQKPVIPARAKATPTMAWRSLPLVLGGGTPIDFFPTMRPVFRLMKRLEEHMRENLVDFEFYAAPRE